MLNGSTQGQGQKPKTKVRATLEQQFALRTVLSRMVREGKIVKHPDGKFEYAPDHSDETVAKAVSENLTKAHTALVRKAMKIEMRAKKPADLRVRTSERLKHRWELDARLTRLEGLFAKLAQELGFKE